MIDRMIGDLGYSLRTLLKARTFTAAVVATIGLAVGATTAIFAVVSGIVLRPLPFEGSERVVALCETNPVVRDWCGASPMNVFDWLRQGSRLESAGVARTESFIARGDAAAYGAMGGIVSPGFFAALRVEPMLGRLIEERDLPRGSNRVVVVSAAFWHARLGADPSVVGRSIVLDGTPFTIVGVLSAGTWMPDPYVDVEIWKPLTASVDDVENRRWRGFTAVGRMPPAVTAEQLRAELDVIRGRLTAAYPEANAGWGVHTIDLREQTVGDVSGTLLVFLGAAGVVLLIACANVAGLLLVRATARATEFAVRASLGAGRGRLVQQLMTESLVLSLAGGALGLLLAVWTTTAFVAVAPPSIPRLTEVDIDGRVAAFAFGVSTLIALAFGLAPARRAWATDLNAPLKGRGSDAGDTRLRAGFTVAQLALALVLIFGAGLLTRTLTRLMRWEPGFERANIVTTWMLPPRQESIRQTVSLMEQVRDTVRTLPGVQRAGLASAGPLFGGEETGRLTIAGRPAARRDDAATVQWFDVDPHYFDTLGLRLARGRGFAASDRAGAAQVAVVNETLARRFFAGEEALGRHVTVENHAAEIVGIVPDVKPVRPDQPAEPQIYWPIQQFPRGAAYLVLRTAPGIGGLEAAIRARVASVDPGIQLSAFATIQERFARRLVSPRFTLLLVGSFAAIAVLLAAVGVYGVMAFTVASRTREFGIRVALGATPAHLVRAVVGRGLRLAALGLAVGAAGAIAAGRLLAHLLYGVPPADPVTLAAAAALLVLVVLAACWAPACRASRVEPASALRAL